LRPARRHRIHLSGRRNRERPDPASQNFEAWNAYVYDRLNPAGDHNEVWQHSGGCRTHLRVVRNTLTHEISSVAFVRGDHASTARRKAEDKA